MLEVDNDEFRSDAASQRDELHHCVLFTLIPVDVAVCRLSRL